MSVVEFIITGFVLFFAFAASHELFRLQSAVSTIKVIAHTSVSEFSYQNLSHILSGAYGDKGNTDQISTLISLEQEVEDTVKRAFNTEIFRWSWFSFEQTVTLKGVRVWVNGPKFGALNAPTTVKIEICLQSWLEPILRITSDHRNCLGQFNSTRNSDSLSRGVSFTVIAQRAANVSLPPYFTGHGMDSLSKNRGQR